MNGCYACRKQHTLLYIKAAYNHERGILMAHIQYSVTDYENHQPIERLLYISSSTYGNDWISLLHSHSFSELFFVASGSGTLCTENSTIPLHPNTLVTINPNVPHTEKSNPGDPLTYIVLAIDNLRFDFEHNSTDGCGVYDLSRHRSDIMPLLEMMITEGKSKKATYEQICQHYLAALLLKIQRCTNSAFSFNITQQAPGECEYIKNYMDSHYQEPLSLDDLAKLAHLNKYYLSHMFSDVYGISPINYLLERRIIHSKELLRNSTFSITQIAHMTGFSSSNYFSQAFKKYTGNTPQAYRKKKAFSLELSDQR